MRAGVLERMQPVSEADDRDLANPDTANCNRGMVELGSRAKTNELSHADPTAWSSRARIQCSSRTAHCSNASRD